MMDWLTQHWALIGGLVTVALSAFVLVAKFTPNKTDDQIAGALSKGWSFIQGLMGNRAPSAPEAPAGSVSKPLLRERASRDAEDEGPSRQRLDL